MKNTLLIDCRFNAKTPTGIGSYLCNNFQELTKGDYDVVILLNSNKGFYKLAPKTSKYIPVVTKLHPMSGFNTLLYLWIFLKSIFVGNLIKKCIYPHYCPPVLFLPLTTIVVHDLFPLEVENYYERLGSVKKFHFETYCKLSSKCAREIIFVSITTAIKFARLIGIQDQRKIKILHSRKIKHSTERYLNKKIYYYIGDDRPHKCISRLLNVMGEYVNENGRGILIGNQKKLNDLPKNIEQVGVMIEEKYNKFLQSKPTLIFVSSTEGFGIPVVEAMENGSFLILSDITIFREITYEYSNKKFVTNDSSQIVFINEEI